MSIAELGSLGEFVAAIAVLVSLVYLAFQVRQNTKQQRLSAYRDSFAAFSMIRTNIYSNPEFANLLTKATDPNAVFNPPEVLRLESFFNEYVFCNVNLWRLYKEGLVENSDEALEQTLFSVTQLLSSPVAKNWWQEWKAIYPKEFSDRIDNALRDGI